MRADLDNVIAQEVTPFLTSEQLHAFSKVRIDTPVTAAPDPNPFDCFSSRADQITIPLLTIAFVRDMAEAYSWLWANHYSSRTVDEYLGMLDHRAADDFPEKRYPSPLAALHIPANANDDSAVARMTERVRRTTLSFLLLHQFGHFAYRTSAEEEAMKHGESIEEAADQVALEVMKKNSETPAGLLMLIHGMVYVPSSPPKNHPVTEARLKAIADYLDVRVHEFSMGRPDAKLAALAIQSLADHIRHISRFVSDPVGQQYWAEERRKTNIANLVPRQPDEIQ